MLVVHIDVHVKPGDVEAFKQATIANAAESVKEAGIARFDVIQRLDDPTRFVFVEVYRDVAAPAAHKETAHYQAWRDAVAGMMAEPRTSIKFSEVFWTDGV
jgi:autoinducer 2-degrading protein